MTTPVFPLDNNTQGWDSKLYKVTSEDPAIKAEMEGGYMISRPRHTRTPRKTIQFGWHSMADADYQALKAFWNQVFGGSMNFTWHDPYTNTDLTVRFKQAIDETYVGMGDTRLWDVTVTVEQV